MRGFELPEGVQDYLPREAYAKHVIEDKLSEIFERNGYDRAETPVLGYMPLFRGNVGKVDVDKMMKLSDLDGSILVLRPDITLPLTRMVATKMRPDYPVRLYYTGDSYNLKTDNYRLREFTQAGIEFFGERSILSDAEVITIAIECLRELGVKEFLIELGHAGYMNGVMDEYGIVGEDAEELRKLSESKNSLGMSVFLEQRGFHEAERVLRELPALYGRETVLTDAKRLCSNPKCIKAIDDLDTILRVLKRRGLDNYVDIDLGNVPSLNYYTGIIFKGITKGLGAPVLAGGRYDTLGRNFDYDLPATGFGVGIKNLMLALKNASVTIDMPSREVCIVVEDEDVDSAQIERSLMDSGRTFVRYYGNDAEGYSRANGISTLIYISEKETREVKL